jgi:hypothetical protein
MHPSTEDLLSVRDGEPLDAITSNVIAEDATHGREIDRLSEMRDALRRLPDVAPPDDMWARIAAVERATRPRRSTWLLLTAGVGVAAAVAALAIFVIGTPLRQSGGLVQPPALQASEGLPASTTDEPPSTVVGTTTVFDPDRPFVGARIVPATYPALMQESARLDRALRRLSYQRPMMSAETATTIAGLEDRIALIDEQLTYGNARGVPQPERTALWGERVDLMNALVHVRYAQAQP